MTQLTINLPDEIAANLYEAAAKIGTKPEDLMLLSLQEKPASLDAEFSEAMNRVLQKNAELYQRLAQ